METFCVYILPSPKRRILHIRVTNDSEEGMNIGIEKKTAHGGISIVTWERVDSRFRGNDTISGGSDTISGGSDTISGGNDTISGGSDTISGGNDNRL
jgi:hypothetical protein